MGAGLGAESRERKWLRKKARVSGKRRGARTGSGVPGRLAGVGTAAAPESRPGGLHTTPERPWGGAFKGSKPTNDSGGGEEEGPSAQGREHGDLQKQEVATELAPGHPHSPTRGGERQAGVSGPKLSRGTVESEARGHGGPKRRGRGGGRGSEEPNRGKPRGGKRRKTKKGRGKEGKIGERETKGREEGECGRRRESTAARRGGGHRRDEGEEKVRSQEGRAVL